MSYAVKKRRREDEIEALDAYMIEISKYGNLTAQQERHLAERIQAGDKAALDKLVQHNLRLVMSIAKRYQNQGLEMDDLVQAGNEGLINAAKHYDPNTARFTTYATYWIKQTIGRTVESRGRAIRLPSYVASEVRAIKNAHTSYLNEKGIEPSIERVAEMTGLEPERILEINTACGVISLDKNRLGDDDAGSDENSSIYDMLAEEDGTEREIEKIEIQEAIKKALAQLSDRERLIVKLRFGLIDGKTRSLECVGNELGVTRERIRQIEAGALRDLRKMDSLRQLCDGPIKQVQGNQFHRQSEGYTKQQKAGETRKLMGTGYKKR